MFGKFFGRCADILTFNSECFFFRLLYFLIITILFTGFSTKVTTEDLGEYFKEFNPVSCEWCDGKSANIVWGLDASAAKAMCYLSRPIGTTSEDAAMENEAANGLEKSEALAKRFENSQFNDVINIKEIDITEPTKGKFFKD